MRACVVTHFAVEVRIEDRRLRIEIGQPRAAAAANLVRAVASGARRVSGDQGVTMLRGFSHIGIALSDIDLSARFSIDVFGFRQLYALDFAGDEVAATMEQEGAFSSCMLLREDVRIELLQWVDVPISGTGQRKPMTELGFTHLSFRVDHVDELSDAVRAAGGLVHDHTLTILASMVTDLHRPNCSTSRTRMAIASS